MKKIAVLGFGVVGAGVCRLLTENKKALDNAELAYICDLRDFPGSEYGDMHIKDFNIILNDPDVAVVVEVTGARKAAYELSMKALGAGKSVVTSNKEVVAEYGAELLAAARKNGVSYLFEASVGGTIPLIRTLRTSLATDKVKAIYGILNGTTNYILTTMGEYGSEYGKALADAQRLGYAEPDPTSDVEGIDTCRKVSILSAFIGGGIIPPSEIPTTGISRIPTCALSLAKKLGGKIKLIGSAEKTGRGVHAEAGPRFVAYDNILHSVDGVFNGIVIKCEYSSLVTLCGRGAGSIPTAAAVMSDVAEALTGRVETLKWRRVNNAPGSKKSRATFIVTKGEPDVIKECKIIKKITDDGYGAYLVYNAPCMENAPEDILFMCGVL